MPKLLSDILKGKKSSKVEDGSTGENPGVDYKPKAGDEQKFVAKHKTEKHDDRVGNGPDVYAGGKTKEADFPKQSQDAYEEVEQVDEKKKWIAGAIKKPGALHRQLGVPQDEKIPAGKLAAAAEKGGKLGKRARLAQTLKKVNEEYDDREEETSMVKAELRALADKADELVKKMPSSMHVEPWVQAKIAMAKLNVSSVHDYMIYGEHDDHGDGVKKKRMKEEVEQVDEVSPTFLRKAADAAGKEHDLLRSLRKFHTGTTSISPSNPEPADEKKRREQALKFRLAALRKEEVEQVDEVLTKKSPAGEWIKDFVKSDNPKFAGKSKKERTKQALAAYYAKQRNEEHKKPDDKMITEKSKCSKCGGTSFKSKGDKMVCEQCDTPINMSRSGGEGEPNKIAAYNLDVARV